MDARVLSVNVGAARLLELGGKRVPSGIFKTPVVCRLRVTEHGFLGDEQADRRNHGGPDKAVNVYPSEHLPYWSERLDVVLGPGAFGENLTTAGLSETGVSIGDVFRIGSARLQVSQPRQPCAKLSAKHGEPQVHHWVEETGRTGFYLRVLEPGEIGAGDAIQLESRDPAVISVLAAYRTMQTFDDPAAIERLLAVPALSTAWRERLQRRLQRL